MRPLHLLLAISTLLLLACHADEEDHAASKHIYVMFSPGGLGDNGYNDLIFSGVQQFTKSQEPDLVTSIMPNDTNEATSTLHRWLIDNSSINSLFVLAASDYEDLITNNASLISALPDSKTILLFESSNTNHLPIHTFRISLYGASYLAGLSVASLRCSAPLAILGAKNDHSIQCAIDGFSLGFGSDISVEYMADTYEGYAMAEEAYQCMTNYAMSYDFFFCVAGGSNLGVYRYLRQYPNGLIWASGMDVDQSNLSDKITGSVVKHIDKVIYNYLTDWMDGNTLPDNAIYGLQSGYVEWVISPYYSDFFDTFVDDNLPDAINKENSFEGL